MKNVIITGGSRGIGAAAVRAFAQRGDRVWFFYAKSEEAACKLAAETGAVAVQCDVARRNAVFEAFAALPTPDVLVCNAGIWQGGIFHTMEEADYDRMFDVNVKGVYNCVSAAMGGLLQKKDASIITVSSMWGQVGASCEVAYSATKGAVIAMTKALAKELGPSNIRVNCVAPGVILTDMCAGFSEEALRELAQEAPLGRNGTPEDVAKAMVYLADAPFITGQVLPVNGGMVI